jgi:hypothetical protein
MMGGNCQGGEDGHWGPCYTSHGAVDSSPARKAKHLIELHVSSPRQNEARIRCASINRPTG